MALPVALVNTLRSGSIGVAGLALKNYIISLQKFEQVFVIQSLLDSDLKKLCGRSGVSLYVKHILLDLRTKNG